VRITVYGAANDVTGSCYLLEADNCRFLVDCGMFQGSEKLERLNYIPKGVNPKSLDAVILTHGHLDHCGRLPLLAVQGYKGPIYCTEPTARIAELVMTDSAKIQEEDTERENRKRAEQRLPPLEPLYDVDAVTKACKQFKTVEYGHPIDIASGVTIKLVEAGHILGSACVEIVSSSNGSKREFVFSGDIGQWNVPILQDPAEIKDNVQLVFMESTYGERNHRPLEGTLEEFRALLRQAVAQKGKVLIPTFAVGRAQTILFYLAEAIRDKVIDPIPIFLDSPMAIAATEIYNKFVSFMDDESKQLHCSGELQKDLQSLQLCTTVDESKAINQVEGPCVIMAGSGMLNAGRILHHLQHNLGAPENIVMIVGYQPNGSLGRLMLNGAKTVKIMRETVPVRATIRGLGGFSAHAGQQDLLKWLEPMAPSKPRVVLVHGESHAMDELAYLIKDKYGIAAEKPHLGDVLTV
jgi:metallo-beta-lactamase family protein